MSLAQGWAVLTILKNVSFVLLTMKKNVKGWNLVMSIVFQKKKQNDRFQNNCSGMKQWNENDSFGIKMTNIVY